MCCWRSVERRVRRQMPWISQGYCVSGDTSCPRKTLPAGVSGCQYSAPNLVPARASACTAAARELPGRSWRVVDGRFQYYTVRGNRNVVDSDYEVTWETPDRVRLRNPSMKTPTIVWRRL